MRIAAVDPGVESGWAYVDLEDSDLDVLRARGTTVWLKEWGGNKRVRSGQCVSEDEVQNALEVCNALGEVHVVAVESFELRASRKLRGRGALAPKGVGTLLRAAYGERVVMQSASQAKSVVTDDRLKDWGLWVKGQQHARDAIRHLVVALRAAR